MPPPDKKNKNTTTTIFGPLEARKFLLDTGCIMTSTTLFMLLTDAFKTQASLGIKTSLQGCFAFPVLMATLRNAVVKNTSKTGSFLIQKECINNSDSESQHVTMQQAGLVFGINLVESAIQNPTSVNKARANAKIPIIPLNSLNLTGKCRMFTDGLTIKTFDRTIGIASCLWITDTLKKQFQSNGCNSIWAETFASLLSGISCALMTQPLSNAYNFGATLIETSPCQQTIKTSGGIIKHAKTLGFKGLFRGTASSSVVTVGMFFCVRLALAASNHLNERFSPR